MGDGTSPGTRCYRARRAVTMSGQGVIENAGVVVRDGRIVAVGPFDEVAGAAASIEDLGEVVVLPGLINAHCHLDYTAMRGAILPTTNFSGWIRRLNDLKRTLSDEDYVASIESGIAELAANGTTTVLNIGSFPSLLRKIQTPPIRVWWFFEMLDIRAPAHPEETVRHAEEFFSKRGAWMGGFGLSPHAPYTTSLDLYQRVRDAAQKFGLPVTTHLAETEEEFDMFTHARGPLWEFLSGLGRDMHDTGRHTPIAHLLSAGVLPRGTILAHMNRVTDDDAELLRANAARFPVVHCPRCHRFFDRPPFPYERLRDLGIRISLGTDSCASNSELNLFSEMREFQKSHPTVSPREIVEMVTTRPAAALEMSGRLGVLAPNAKADFIAIADDATRNPFELAAHTQRPERIVVNGRFIS